ncbi:hypothetical protein DL93DRAFT_590225 [Clavulina sp. PMI_390]|nr:hypothetical protein DL93DRAFT_590225 [Clavulina sp. PMI_390]
MASLKDKLTLSIDVGTAQSAVAVTYVSKEKGNFTTLVDSWPHQEGDLQLARVPTALLYSQDNQLLACGAEVQSMLQTDFQIEGAVRYKLPQYFKMQLHPQKPKLDVVDPRTSLPLIRLYADYLRYLLNHTRNHLKRYLGFDPWAVVRDSATIVLSHPNKWGSDQQVILRQAAIAAGLISPRDVASRLHFVEEAEAAASFALLKHPGLKGVLNPGARFVVCDAGGSTVDVSSYVVKSHTPSIIEINELAPPFSLEAGGIYVDMSFSLHFTETLASYLADNPEDLQFMIDDAMKEFETQSKRRFIFPTDTMQVKFGPRSLNLPKLGVRKGTLEIPGSTANNFFQPSVENTAVGLLGVRETQDVSVIILTGGFAESPYLKRVVRERLEAETGCRIVLANHATSKAVVVGALSLVHGAEQSVKIKRKPRSWKTWLSEIFAH